MWDWMAGPRFVQRGDDGNWQTRPLSLNIDDLRGIVNDMGTLLPGTSTTVQGAAPNRTGDSAYDRWHDIDLDDPHAIDVGKVTIARINEISPEDAPHPIQDLSIILNFGPYGCDSYTSVGAARFELDNLAQFQKQTLSRIENARARAVAPARKAELLVLVLRVLMAGLFVWLAATWRSIPGLALIGIFAVLLGVSLGRGLLEPRIAQWLITRPPREWLTLKSDAELYSERANNKRDNRIRLITGGITALIGVAGILAAWFRPR
jgi:hypothetical protein